MLADRAGRLQYLLNASKKPKAAKVTKKRAPAASSVSKRSANTAVAQPDPKRLRVDQILNRVLGPQNVHELSGSLPLGPGGRSLPATPVGSSGGAGPAGNAPNTASVPPTQDVPAETKPEFDLYLGYEPPNRAATENLRPIIDGQRGFQAYYRRAATDGTKQIVFNGTFNPLNHTNLDCFLYHNYDVSVSAFTIFLTVLWFFTSLRLFTSFSFERTLFI